jgi:hypothetical protein
VRDSAFFRVAPRLGEGGQAFGTGLVGNNPFSGDIEVRLATSLLLESLVKPSCVETLDYSD